VQCESSPKTLNNAAENMGEALPACGTAVCPLPWQRGGECQQTGLRQPVEAATQSKVPAASPAGKKSPAPNSKNKHRRGSRKGKWISWDFTASLLVPTSPTLESDQGSIVV